MISERELMREISDYEDRTPTYQTCEKLANLYTIYDHLYEKKEPSIMTASEKGTLSNQTKNQILPAYFSYIEAKKSFQQGVGSKENVLKQVNVLSNEIKDFVKMLYRNTDMPEERAKITCLINELYVNIS